MNTKPRNQCVPAELTWLVALDHLRQRVLITRPSGPGGSPAQTPPPTPAVRLTNRTLQSVRHSSSPSTPPVPVPVPVPSLQGAQSAAFLSPGSAQSPLWLPRGPPPAGGWPDRGERSCACARLAATAINVCCPPCRPSGGACLYACSAPRSGPQCGHGGARGAVGGGVPVFLHAGWDSWGTSVRHLAPEPSVGTPQPQHRGPGPILPCRAQGVGVGVASRSPLGW